MYKLVNVKKSSFKLLIFTFGLLFTDIIFATQIGETHVSLGNVANNGTDAMEMMANFLTALSYVIGFAFGVGAILKYKNYRDNPSQVTIGTPIFLAFISLIFVFMPMLFMVAGDTIFGSSATVAPSIATDSF